MRALTGLGNQLELSAPALVQSLGRLDSNLGTQCHSESMCTAAGFSARQRSLAKKQTEQANRKVTMTDRGAAFSMQESCETREHRRGQSSTLSDKTSLESLTESQCQC